MDKSLKLFLLVGIIIGITVGENGLIEKAEISDPLITVEIQGKITTKLNGGKAFIFHTNFGAQYRSEERGKRQTARRDLIEFNFEGTVTSKSKVDELVSGINATLEFWTKEESADNELDAPSPGSNERSTRDTDAVELSQSIYGQFRFFADGKPHKIDFRTTVTPSNIVATRIPVQSSDVALLDSTFKGGFTVKSPHDANRIITAFNLGINVPYQPPNRDKRGADDKTIITLSGKFTNVEKSLRADVALKTEFDLNGELILQEGDNLNQPSPLEAFKAQQSGVYLDVNGNLTAISEGYNLLDSFPVDVDFQYYAGQERRRTSRDTNSKEKTFEIDFTGDATLKNKYHYKSVYSVKSNIFLWLISQKFDGPSDI